MYGWLATARRRRLILDNLRESVKVYVFGRASLVCTLK
jgi:hypothetical protein